MFIANHWKDYEVIDTSGGEKLERWGKYLLVQTRRLYGTRQKLTEAGRK